MYVREHCHLPIRIPTNIGATTASAGIALVLFEGGRHPTKLGYVNFWVGYNADTTRRRAFLSVIADTLHRQVELAGADEASEPSTITNRIPKKKCKLCLMPLIKKDYRSPTGLLRARF